MSNRSKGNDPKTYKTKQIDHNKWMALEDIPKSGIVEVEIKKHKEDKLCPIFVATTRSDGPVATCLKTKCQWWWKCEEPEKCLDSDPTVPDLRPVAPHHPNDQVCDTCGKIKASWCCECEDSNGKD